MFLGWGCDQILHMEITKVKIKLIAQNNSRQNFHLFGTLYLKLFLKKKCLKL